MPVTHDCRRHIPRFPAEKPGSQTEIGIVAEGEEAFVESSGFLENLAMVKRCASVRPEDLFRTVVLSNILLHCAPAAILAVPIDQMSGLVDDARPALKQYLAAQHANSAASIPVMD